MSTHVLHRDQDGNYLEIHEAGLQDNCPRCREHSLLPWESLDNQMLADLRRRIREGLPARSTAEAMAAFNLGRHDAEKGQK